MDRLDEALEAISEALRVGGRQIAHVAQLAVVHGRRGAKDDVAAAIRELESRSTVGSAETALAVACAALADFDAAMQHLRRAVESREPMLLAALVGPTLGAVHDHPQFATVLREAGLAPAVVPA